MAENDFVYAVARIRSKELGLLSASFVDQLSALKEEEESLKLLREKGWGKDGQNATEMLREEWTKTWDLMDDLLGERVDVLDVFRIENDFRNLKAAIKASCVSNKLDGIFSDGGTLPPAHIRAAVENRDFSSLPDRMAKAALEASDLLLKTGDGQISDCILDRAALEEMRERAEEVGEEILREYAELRIASADIKIAVRSCRTEKDRTFMERAMAECETVSKEKLIEAATIGPEAILAYLKHTPYERAVEALKKSPSAFERWCDNVLIRNIRPQLYNSFGLGPLAAYVLARENELKTVRIILSGQRNGISEEEILERVRETYV